MTNIFQLFLDHNIAFSISIVVLCIFAYFQRKCYIKNISLINGLGEFFLNDVYSVGYKTYFNDDVCQIGAVNGKEQLNGLIEEINLYVLLIIISIAILFLFRINTVLPNPILILLGYHFPSRKNLLFR